jgi:hypothetical protein
VLKWMKVAMSCVDCSEVLLVDLQLIVVVIE